MQPRIILRFSHPKNTDEMFQQIFRQMNREESKKHEEYNQRQNRKDQGVGTEDAYNHHLHSGEEMEEREEQEECFDRYASGARCGQGDRRDG